MINFFNNSIKAISDLTISATCVVSAKMAGPCRGIDDMRAGQFARYEAFTKWLGNTSLSESQLAARKHYWVAQTFFLHHLLSKNGSEINDKKDFRNELLKLYKLIEAGGVDQFLTVLNSDNTILNKQLTQQIPLNSGTHHPGVHLYRGEAIQLMNKLAKDGYHIVGNDAANSNRDGRAKYSSGSVEEMISRYTDAWKMVLHFENVHERNKNSGMYAFGDVEPPKELDVEEYQARYLMMMLNIVIQFIDKGDAYFGTGEFLNDLFESHVSDDQIPIYFDMQNNVYEVPIGGFASIRAFFNTKNLHSIDDIFGQKEANKGIVPLTVVSYAAPDQRILEVAPLDKRCTSNKLLQNPEGPDVLTQMLVSGVSKQCDEAVRLAQNNKNQPVAVLFIMPGCGAFGNPEDISSKLFFNAIKENYPALEKNSVTVYIAERNSDIFSTMASSCREIMGNKIPHFIDREQLLTAQGAPAQHCAAMMNLRQTIEMHASMDEIEHKIDELQHSFLKDSSLKYPNLSVTCDVDGHLVLQAHLAYKDGGNKFITIGTFQRDFYHDVLNEKNVLEKDQTRYAIQVRDVIKNKFPKKVDGWNVVEFVDLILQRDANQFADVPDFHLDLMGSGETHSKYKDLKSKNPSLFKNDGISNTRKVAIDGPSHYLGDGFDANVIRGFCELLNKIGSWNKSDALKINISGHGRGGVEAIAINNLLVQLKQAAQEDISSDVFINTVLKPIKSNPDAFCPAEFNKTIKQLIDSALYHLPNTKIGLTLLDPVQGHFQHNAFLIAKSLNFDPDMNTRVDIIMGSRESSSYGFDLHLPNVSCAGDLADRLTIYKVNCNHGDMEKKLNNVSPNAGSFEGQYSACILSGRMNKAQTMDDLKNNNRPQHRVVEPSYINREKVYAAGAMKAGEASHPIKRAHNERDDSSASIDDYSCI